MARKTIKRDPVLDQIALEELLKQRAELVKHIVGPGEVYNFNPSLADRQKGELRQETKRTEIKIIDSLIGKLLGLATYANEINTEVRLDDRAIMEKLVEASKDGKITVANNCEHIDSDKLMDGAGEGMSEARIEIACDGINKSISSFSEPSTVGRQTKISRAEAISLVIMARAAGVVSMTRSELMTELGSVHK